MTGWHRTKRCEIQEERENEQRSKEREKENSVESATGVDVFSGLIKVSVSAKT